MKKSCLIIVTIILLCTACLGQKNEEVFSIDSCLNELLHMQVLFVNKGRNSSIYREDSKVLDKLEWNAYGKEDNEYWSFSFDRFRNCVYIYETITGDIIHYSDDDFFNLINTDSFDTKIYEELKDICDWFIYKNGLTIDKIFFDGETAALKLYKQKYDSDFINKERAFITAEENKEIINWVIENPDYEYAEKNNDYRELLIVLGLLKEE